MISLSDYWMGRDRQYEEDLSQIIRDNAEETVRRANKLLAEFGEDRAVNSGWRPPSVNAATPGSALKSKHMTGQAIDLADPEGDLDEWAMEHPEILERLGLWQEFPGATKGWAHFQIIPPKSGNRVFFP